MSFNPSCLLLCFSAAHFQGLLPFYSLPLSHGDLHSTDPSGTSAQLSASATGGRRFLPAYTLSTAPTQYFFKGLTILLLVTCSQRIYQRKGCVVTTQTYTGFASVASWLPWGQAHKEKTKENTLKASVVRMRQGALSPWVTESVLGQDADRSRGGSEGSKEVPAVLSLGLVFREPKVSRARCFSQRAGGRPTAHTLH
jgi:hypothetical protein